MDAPQNSGQGQNNQANQNAGQKTQLSWSQPATPVKPVHTPVTPQQKKAAGNSGSNSRPNNTPEEKSYVTRNLTVAAVAILVIGGIAWAVTGNRNSTATPGSATMGTSTMATSTSHMGMGSTTTNVTMPAVGTTQTTFPSGSLTIPTPQTAGLQIAVSNIAVQVPTWVVIYENYNGQPGNVLGAGLFTSTHTSGVVELLRGTLPGQTYFAGEARDDGDHMFSMVNDPSTRDASGNPVTVTFQTK